MRLRRVRAAVASSTRWAYFVGAMTAEVFFVPRLVNLPSSPRPAFIFTSDPIETEKPTRAPTAVKTMPFFG